MEWPFSRHWLVARPVGWVTAFPLSVGDAAGVECARTAGGGTARPRSGPMVRSMLVLATAAIAFVAAGCAYEEHDHYDVVGHKPHLEHRYDYHEAPRHHHRHPRHHYDYHHHRPHGHRYDGHRGYGY